MASLGTPNTSGTGIYPFPHQDPEPVKATHQRIFEHAHAIATMIAKKDENSSRTLYESADTQQRRQIERATEISRITADIVEAVAQVNRG